MKKVTIVFCHCSTGAMAVFIGQTSHVVNSQLTRNTSGLAMAWLACFVAMDRVRRERRQADRDILCAISSRCAVLDPLTFAGDDRLAGAHLNDAALVLRL